jgi:serine/threonine protein kinase
MQIRGDQLERGSLIGGYRIDEVISRGGMGIVYRATNIALHRVYALKVLVPELSNDVTFRDRFKREMRIAASLHHPNVVGIHYAGEHEGQLFLVMDFIYGTDLRQIVIKDGALEPDRAVDLLVQFASALDAAHAKGLVHRDVKPANMLVTVRDAEEHGYLTDFGLAKRSDNVGALTQKGVVVGTVDYMAPEQITGNPTDARTDIYALGCVFFEMLTGKVPYKRENSVAVLFAHVHDPPPVLPEALATLHPTFGAVIEKAMTKDPDSRYLSPGDFARDAAAALSGMRYAGPPTVVATGEARPTIGGEPVPARPAAAEPIEPAAHSAPPVTPPPRGDETRVPATTGPDAPAEEPAATIAPDPIPAATAHPDPSPPATTGTPATTSAPAPTGPPATREPPPTTPPPDPGRAESPPAAVPPSIHWSEQPAAAAPPSGGYGAPPAPQAETVPPGTGGTSGPPPAPPVSQARAGAGAGPADGRPARSRWLALGGVVVAAAVIAVIIVLLTGGSSPTPPPAAAPSFAAAVRPVPTNKVTGAGTATVQVHGNLATVTVNTNGLLNAVHLMHIHGGTGNCPPASAAVVFNGHRFISASVGDKFYGGVVTSLTTQGDTSAATHLESSLFPATGNIQYKRTIMLGPGVASEIRQGLAVIVVHGISYDGKSAYDNFLGRGGESGAPALCGALFPAQTASAGTAGTGNVYVASIRAFGGQPSEASFNFGLLCHLSGTTVSGPPTYGESRSSHAA